MTFDLYACLNPDCGVPVRGDEFACDRCWRRVPQRMRSRLSRAFDACFGPCDSVAAAVVAELGDAHASAREWFAAGAEGGAA